MFSMKFASVALVVVLSVLSAAPRTVSALGARELDTPELQEILDRGSPLFVKFYAPWCGHCQRMAPAFDEVARELVGEASVGKVDGTQHQHFAQRFSATGYPSLFLIRDGEVYRYNGARTAVAMISFVKEGYKSAEPMSYWTSPLGPVGVIKGQLVSFGTSVMDMYTLMTKGRGWPAPVVIAAFTVLGVGTVFVLINMVEFMFSSNSISRRNNAAAAAAPRPHQE